MLKATMGLAAAVNRGAQDDVDLGGGPRLSSVSLMVREEGRGETPRSGGGWNPSRGVGGMGWGRLGERGGEAARVSLVVGEEPGREEK